MADTPDVIVVGGGIVGCATAYYLAREGLQPLLLERATTATEASGANAGMVGPIAGLESGTMDFLLPSLDLLWRATDELDQGFDLIQQGHLRLAADETDLAKLRHFVEAAEAAGIQAERLDGLATRALEPILSDRVIGSVHVPAGGQLDPVLATRAFELTARRLGARIETGVEVTGLETSGGRVVGVRTAEGVRSADGVVLAAGAWSAALAGTVGVEVPVRPGKGQMFATEPLPRLTGRVLRGPIVGMRQNRIGEVISGSTVEYVGFDKEVHSETIAEHHRLMSEIVPALKDARIGRTWAGLRPMTPDSLPIIGPAPGVDGLWLAAGHSRTGMSYGPGTGRAVADLIVHGRSSLPLERFALDRFTAVG